MNPAPADYMLASMSRMISDGDTVVTGLMSWLPMLAIQVARQTHAPRLTHVNCAGCLDPAPSRMPASSVDVSLLREGQTFVELTDLWDFAAKGSIHVMFFGAAQIDARGDTNTSWLAKETGGMKLPGVAGARALRRMVRQPVVFLPRHTPVTLPRRVDRVTTCSAQPVTLVSGKGVFRVADETLEILSLHPGVSADEVRAHTAFEVRSSAQPAVTPDPTAGEMAALARFDPNHLRYRMVEQ